MMMAANFPPLFPAERQEKIAAFVASRGKIRLDELASVFEVSQPTLRKDLTVLSNKACLSGLMAVRSVLVRQESEIS